MRLAWPRTLFGRLVLILAAGLLAAQALTFALVFAERGLTMRGMMVSYLAADVASSVAMLDRLPSAERADWLPRLQRPNYRLFLGGGAGDADPASEPRSESRNESNRESPLASQVVRALARASSRPVRILDGGEDGLALSLTLPLHDGTPVRVAVADARVRVSPWMVAALAAQAMLLIAACVVAVRQATRPLARLADAASALAPGEPATPMEEAGPREVAYAASAFNRMRERIDRHAAERNQMLAAISHDLQTPITRMRLRAELLADDAVRDRFQADLAQMQHLVEQGLAYARSTQAVHESLVSTDIVALLESIVADYQEASQPVHWLGGPPCTLPTRPRALRRAIENLIDNAVKFGGWADVVLAGEDGDAVVQVMDRGPGIAAADRGRVLQPFQRIDESRHPAIGGSGLGLAIVQRLLPHCRAGLSLVSREGGGLVARIRIDAMPGRPAR